MTKKNKQKKQINIKKIKVKKHDEEIWKELLIDHNQVKVRYRQQSCRGFGAIAVEENKPRFAYLQSLADELEKAFVNSKITNG